MSCAIAQELGLEQDMIEGIGMGGIIHDLGKISVAAVQNADNGVVLFVLRLSLAAGGTSP
ncbi:MAG: hypothetical protein KZQ97_19250 [Candidatus Thiodiazotropha sp. (ex Dulcina madagascariensis)]|nr:hypothetical protein [Candidatus Thiodiazotropha sp. (ex Dulcina madagascariensis)]